MDLLCHDSAVPAADLTEVIHQSSTPLTIFSTQSTLKVRKSFSTCEFRVFWF